MGTEHLPEVVLVGAGNVGYHLGQALTQHGIPVRQVFSRTEKKARQLALLTGSGFTTRLKKIDPDARLYILAVRDDAVREVAQQMSQVLPDDKLVVHTSGATPCTVLQPYFRRAGVFYPLQTFSIDRDTDFSTLPICIDAVEAADLNLLEGIARQLTDSVHRINDEQRAVLHVAAVFVNNFSNFLFRIGKDILDREQLPFDLLRPLILETAKKIQNQEPLSMQTGPAIRGDQETIRRHLDFLEKYPEYRELYQQLTQKILELG